MSNKHEEDFKTFLHSDVVRYERPPVSPKIQILPLTELDWKTFEQLCCRLVERQLGVEGTPHLYGVPGDDQAGVDIVARRRVGDALQTWCYQCKNYKYFSPGHFQRAIVDLEYEAHHYVFFVASPAQASLRDIAMEYDQVELWDGEDISRKLKDHPDLVAEFFHPAWVEGFVVTPGQSTHNAREKSISGVSIEAVEGDIRDSVIVGRDFVLQIVGQTGGQIPPARNLPAQLAALQGALPHLPHPAEKAAAQAAIEKLEEAIAALPTHEEAYRQRLKARYGKLSSYFVELVAETSIRTEQVEADPNGLDLAEVAQLMSRLDDFEALAELRKWEVHGQEIKRVKLESLRAGVEEYLCIILLGDPGSGKTTALQHLAYQYADEPLPPPTGGRAGEEGKLPIPLRLNEFLPEMSVTDFILQGWGGSLRSDHWGAPQLTANLEGYLEAGRLFFLFDALNEMPREGYAGRAQVLRQFIDRWSSRGNRFLVTCRVLDYGTELSGLQRVEIQPFNDEQIQTFLKKVLGQHWGRFWAPLTDGSSEARRLLEMARNPYVLQMMLTVFVRGGGRLDSNRAALMNRFTRQLWRRAKRKCPPGEWLDVDVQREALSALAFETQKRAGFGTMVKMEQVQAVMPTQVQPDPNWPPVPAPPDRVLSLAAGANMIEMPGDRSSLRFYHQLLQEYFAAHHMLKRDPESLAGLWRWPWLEADMPLWVRPEDNYDPLPPPPPTGWEETTVLAAGLAAENDDQLVRALIEVNPVLAGRCLHEGQAKVDQTVRGAVIDSLLSAIADAEVALRVRIAAGEVLGYLGDPRLGEMVVVPAGKFLMGEDEKQHELYLPAYRLGVYPVTNAEYGRFIEAGGYGERRWWTVGGWARKEKDGWTEPRWWDDSRFNVPNQPVVGVSWYECVAYCRWLSAESGELYRLATEAEWEKGARGVDGRRYPWGDGFEAGRLNAREGEQVVWATTPVGIYPGGRSRVGAYDCAGNVWEWCATKVHGELLEPRFKRYPYDASEDEWTEAYLEGKDMRVLRGGSWFDVRNRARCAYRSGGSPHSWYYDGGLRVVSPI